MKKIPYSSSQSHFRCEMMRHFLRNNGVGWAVDAFLDCFDHWSAEEDKTPESPPQVTDGPGDFAFTPVTGLLMPHHPQTLIISHFLIQFTVVCSCLDFKIKSWISHNGEIFKKVKVSICLFTVLFTLHMTV